MIYVVKIGFEFNECGIQWKIVRKNRFVDLPVFSGSCGHVMALLHSRVLLSMNTTSPMMLPVITLTAHLMPVGWGGEVINLIFTFGMKKK